MGAGRTHVLVGRDEDLAVVLAHAGAAGNVVIAGAAGVGKTELASVAAQRLSRGDATVLRLSATRASATIPYGVLAHLLPDTPLVAPGALRWIADSLVRLGQGDSPLLLVDDAHLLDAASAVLVHHLVATGRARTLVTIRTGEPAPDPVMALWKSELAGRVDLAPLNQSATGLMASALLAGPVAPATARRLHELSGGNPLLLRELTFAARSAGAFSGPPWHLTSPRPTVAPRLIELLEDRIGHLDSAEAELLELVALGEPLQLDHVVRLCGEDVVEAGETRELVRVAETDAGPEVRLAHPLFGEVVRQRCGTMRTRRRYRELARTAPAPRGARDQLSHAVWQLEAGLTDDPDLLLNAARVAWIAHDHGLAGRFAKAAGKAGAGPQAAILLAATHNYRQEPDVSLRVLDEVRDRLTLDRDRAEHAMTRAFALAMMSDGVADAIDTLDRAVSAISDLEWQQTLTALRITVLSRGVCATELVQMADRLLADGPVTAAIRAQALSSRAGGALGLGRFDTAAASSQEAIADLPAWHDRVPVQVLPLFMNNVWANMYGGDLDEAERSLSALREVYGSSADVPDLDGAQQMGHSQIRMLRGQLPEALESLDPPIDQPYFAAGRHAQHAQVLAMCGAAGEAEQALDRARRTAAPRYVVIEAGWIMLATSWVAAATDTAAAIRTTIEAADVCDQRGVHALELILCHYAVRFGAADQVAGRIGKLAETAEGKLPKLYARHAAAAVARDGEELERVAADFRRLGYLTHAADAAAQAATTHHRAARADAAVRARRTVAHLLEQCPGLRTPALAELRTPDLTRRQQEVAGLAAEGLSSQEIADRLHVAVRTVDNTLRVVYEKLGVPNRRALRALLKRPSGLDLKSPSGVTVRP